MKKKYRNLKQKIIFYVMSVSILITILITAIMSNGSAYSTDAILIRQREAYGKSCRPKYQL